MYQRPEYFVWIEITGLLCLLAVLLGPLALLATELMGGGGGGGGVAGSVSGGPPPAAAQGGPQLPGGPTPIAGLSPGGRRGEAGATPFSKEWRKRATPDLTGPSAASSGGASGGGEVGSASPGPSVTSSRPSRAYGRGDVRASETGGSSWRAEARRLAGRARALSSQLRQMDRSSSESGGTTSSQKHASASAAWTGASASGPGSPGDPSRRGDPGSPSNVPIGDHLHWLAVAGLLWGIWRLWRGG